MTFSREDITIIEDKSGELEANKFSITSTSDNLVDVFTRKQTKIMWLNDEEVLQHAKWSTDDQSADEDHHMPVSYKEYNKKLDEKEIMDYWVKKSSLIGNPLSNQDSYAGNSVAPLTFPLFVTMIRYVPFKEIFIGLKSHPMKERVIIFLIFKVLLTNCSFKIKTKLAVSV